MNELKKKNITHSDVTGLIDRFCKEEALIRLDESKVQNLPVGKNYTLYELSVSDEEERQLMLNNFMEEISRNAGSNKYQDILVLMEFSNNNPLKMTELEPIRKVSSGIGKTEILWGIHICSESKSLHLYVILV